MLRELSALSAFIRVFRNDPGAFMLEDCPFTRAEFPYPPNEGLRKDFSAALYIWTRSPPTQSQGFQPA